MNELTDNTNTVNNPEQAVAEFVGEQFIEWLMDHIGQQMLVMPEILILKTAKVRPEKIKKFILQRFLAAEAFLGSREGDPGFLRFAIANLSESDDPTAESALEILEQKRLEELAGRKIERGTVTITGRELWLKLLMALGLSSEEIERAEAKEPTRNYIAELSEVYSTSEWQTAVGALAALERAIPEEYRAILTMLQNNTSLNVKDFEIFTVDIGSGTKYKANADHILDKIVFDHETKLLVWEGVKRQMEIRKEFLASLIKYLEG
ncbi:MAG: hypothetical protein WDN47_03350 [Candidatus Doudnabacteria bacterium]